eukprot:g41551.t1
MWSWVPNRLINWSLGGYRGPGGGLCGRFRTGHGGVGERGWSSLLSLVSPAISQYILWVEGPDGGSPDMGVACSYQRGSVSIDQAWTDEYVHSSQPLKALRGARQVQHYTL